MASILTRIRDLLRRHTDEPEYEEAVKHDVVMLRVNGKMVEVTDDDPEVREQQ